MGKTERLDKIISTQTSYSRKDIKRMAKQSEICVNGSVCKNADIKIDPEKDEVTVKGEKIAYKQYVYYMMNKPKGVLSASCDKIKKYTRNSAGGIKGVGFHSHSIMHCQQVIPV